MPNTILIQEAEKLKRDTGIRPIDNYRMALNHKIPYWIPSMYIDAWIVQPCKEGERYSGLDKGKDWFGVEWTYEPSVMAPMPTPGKILFEEIEDWREYVCFPDLESIDWEKQAYEDLHTDYRVMKVTGVRQPLPNGASIVDPDKFGIAIVINGMFERMHSLMGFDNALAALAVNPESCYEFFGAVADYKIQLFQKIGKYYPVQMINAHDDYGAKDRMLMSPETWRKLLKPHLKRMVDAVHDMGLYYEHHSCGYIEPIIPDLIEIGVDALDPLQAGNVNIRQIKDKYQKQLTFVGGIDNQGVLEQPGCTIEQQKMESYRVTDLLAPGGSFISFPHFADESLLPTQLEAYLEYSVAYYKKKRQGPYHE